MTEEETRLDVLERMTDGFNAVLVKKSFWKIVEQ